MLKIKLSIIYTIIFCLISSSFAELAAAQPSPPAEISPAITSSEVLDTATEKVALGATFTLSDESKEEIAQEMSKPQTPAPTGWDKFADHSLGTLQSFVTTLVILGVSWVREKAHERNMRATPENRKKLIDEAGENFSKLRVASFATVGTFDTGGVSIGLVAAATRNPAVDAFLTKDIGKALFKYLVAGVLFSIGTDWINGFINSGAELVLNYPKQFGGFSTEEQATIKLLQTQGNFTFYLSEIFFGMGSIGQDPHKSLILHNICWKVQNAIMYILFRDEQLRSALWTHLISSAALQGKSAIIIVTTALSSLISDKVLPSFISKPVTRLGKFGEGIGVSLAVGTIASFIPTQISDRITVFENNRIAVADRDAYLAKLSWYQFRNNGSMNEARSDQFLHDSLDAELSSRESRLIKYAYIMQLCLTRIDSYASDRQTLIDNHNAGQNNFTNIRKIGQLAGAAVTNYNNPSGLNYVRQIGDPVKDLGSQLVDLNVGTYESALSENQKGRGYYQDLFRKASDKMANIYANDQVVIQNLTLQFHTERQHDRIALEVRNLQQMQIYVRHVTDQLQQSWSKGQPTVANDFNKQFVEEVSFWGIKENDVLQTINALRFSMPGTRR